MRHRRLPVLLWIWLLALLASCGPKANLVAVLPDANGLVGAIVVRDAAGEKVLDQAYAAAQAGRGARAVETVRIDPKDVQEIFANALAARPMPPATFRLYFVSDSQDLTPESRIAFEEVFRNIEMRPAADVTVTGHTDTLAADDYNDRLSLARADFVREQLIVRGIAPDAVRAAGRGKRELLVATADNVSEPRNRRVEITIR
jgi:outer membrane protein OmpA-like peptidoglycan-associated protein